MAVAKINLKIEQPDGSKITVADAIIRALKAGAFLRDAALAAGISESCVHGWLARGRQHHNDNGERLKRIPKTDLPYLEFLESVEKARGEQVIFALAVIRKAAQEGNWQAAAWYLERTRPDEYGRRTRFDVGGAGDDGKALTVAELLMAAGTDPDTADADPDLETT